MPTTRTALLPQTLSPLLAAQPSLLFAVLVGSRATGQAHADSDWDIALQWDHTLPWHAQFKNPPF